MFTLSNYQGQVFNTGDFNNFAQVFFIKLMSQMNACSYNTFLVAVDNRMSNVAFFSGLVSNLAVESFQHFYLGQSTPTYLSIQYILNNISSLNFEDVGKGAQLLIAKLVNYTAPNVKTPAYTY